MLDPHTAIGVSAARRYINEKSHQSNVVVLSTAHPIKFQSEIEPKIKFTIPYPADIYTYLNKPSFKTSMEADYNRLKEYLYTIGK